MSVTIDGVKFYNKSKNRRFLLVLLGVFEFILTIFLVIILAANVLMPEKAKAAEGVSSILSYQGRLTDSSGNPLGGTGTNYCFRFSIYDDATVGPPDNPLWPSGTPSDNIVNVADGVFNVGIGEVDDLSTSTFNFASNTTVYLNVEVATSSGAVCGPYDNLAPRQRIDAVAYARVAYDLYGGQVRIGTGMGSTGIPKLLYLDVKNTSDTIGGACSPSGILWYNSNNTRALVCDNGTIQEIGNLGTIVGLGISGNTTGTPATITSGTITLAGGANVTLSQAGNAITISAGTAGGGGSIGAISAGTTQATSGTVVFSDSNNVSFGMDGQTITASAAGGGGVGLNTAGTNVTWTVNSSGISLNAGAYLTTAMASNASTQFVQANANFYGTNASGTIASNNISVSVDEPGGAEKTISYWDNIGLNSATAAIGGKAHQNSTLMIFPLDAADRYFPGRITANTLYFDLSQSGSTATLSAAHTTHVSFGIYTRNASTLSLLDSVYTSYGAAVTNKSNSNFNLTIVLNISLILSVIIFWLCFCSVASL